MNGRGIVAAAAWLAICSLLACDDVGDLGGGSPPAGQKDAAPDAPDDTNGTDLADAADVKEARNFSMSDVVVNASAPLSSRSPDCLACAETSCGMYLHGCEVIVGVATEGPARDAPKAELCVETLACFFKTGCADYRLSNCYCLVDPDTVQVESFCHPPAAEKVGACKTELERSLETTDSYQILSRSGDLTKGGGWAAMLLQCLTDNHCTSCFRGGDAGTDGGEDAADADHPASD